MRHLHCRSYLPGSFDIDLFDCDRFQTHGINDLKHLTMNQRRGVIISGLDRVALKDVSPLKPVRHRG